MMPPGVVQWYDHEHTLGRTIANGLIMVYAGSAVSGVSHADAAANQYGQRRAGAGLARAAATSGCLRQAQGPHGQGAPFELPSLLVCRLSVWWMP